MRPEFPPLLAPKGGEEPSPLLRPFSFTLCSCRKKGGERPPRAAPKEAPAAAGARAMEAAEEGRAGGAQRFRRAATTVAHLCGLGLRSKRYNERSPAVQWATFYLKKQINVKRDLMFNISDYSKKPFQKKGFEKLKHLLHICPKQRRQQDLLQIQACLKTNKSFQYLPSKTQLWLCQALVYQEYEAGTLIIKQGHVAAECYLVLSGKLKVVMDVDSKAKDFTPETLCEAEEGDFIGETCLLTNLKRPASVICKSDVELLVIDKEDFKCILADLRLEQFCATSCFLRKLPIFSTWPPEKIDFLVHCSLRRFYRAGTTVVPNSLNSFFLVIVKSGRCMEAAKLDRVQDGDCSDLNQIPRKSFANEKTTFTGQHLEAAWQMTSKHKSRKQKAQVSSLIPRFLKIRSLEQSDIFGLSEVMDKFCGLQLSLISEGADCIFIPKKLFLEEAPPRSRRLALEMVSSYPTESLIHESYIVQQEWSTYKAKLIGQHLERSARKAPATINL